VSDLENAEIMIGREDWERFLSSLEHLMTVHDKTLERQNELYEKIRTGKAIPPPSITSEDYITRVVTRAVDAAFARYGIQSRPTGLIREPTGRRLADRLQEWLKPSVEATGPTGRNRLGQNYRCAECGYEIRRATMSCEHCGLSFGQLYCACGRGLFSGDKFCDRCGRKV